MDLGGLGAEDEFAPVQDNGFDYADSPGGGDLFN